MVGAGWLATLNHLYGNMLTPNLLPQLGLFAVLGGTAYAIHYRSEQCKRRSQKELADLIEQYPTLPKMID
jgi:hypothetical protein